MIGVEAGRLLGDQRYRGTKANSITSCDNAFVTNILLLTVRLQQMFYLCESEAAAANVLSVRKRSGSNKCFICAKAKRQQQMFSVRKRSGSNKCFICAKAKRQQQMFSVRKRSVSNKCFICAKAKRQQQMFSVRKRSVSNKCFICAKAKRQQQMFYLCESEAAATNVLSVRKRSGSNKAPSCNGNHPFVIAQTLSCQYLIDGDICFIYNHFSS
ncbi:hypothetical protein [Lysinibacillus sp. TE18511]